MLPRVPEESRKDFVADMVRTLLSEGGSGLTGDAFEAFKDELVELIRNARPEEPGADKPAAKG
jgi:hypothetical protein